MVKYSITVIKDYFTLSSDSLLHYFNNFRREPAITNLDWPFTPNYKSSQNFATFTGSVLQLLTFDLFIIRSVSFGFNKYDFKSLSLRLFN